MMKAREIKIELNEKYKEQGEKCIAYVLENIKGIVEAKDEEELDARVNQIIGQAACMAVADIITEDSSDQLIEMANDVGKLKLYSLSKKKRGGLWQH